MAQTRMEAIETAMRRDCVPLSLDLIEANMYGRFSIQLGKFKCSNESATIQPSVWTQRRFESRRGEKPDVRAGLRAGCPSVDDIDDRAVVSLEKVIGVNRMAPGLGRQLPVPSARHYLASDIWS